MSTKTLLIAAAAAAGLVACAGPNGNAPAAKATASSPAPAATAGDYGPTRKVASRDGRSEGEVVGTIAPGSRFAKLQIGMPMSEVTALIGGADGQTSHETGKRWIPFYFANDARRLEVLYKGEGCLTYTGGNAWGSGDNELIRITATTRTDCMD